MLTKYRSLIFLLMTVRFIFSLKIDSENENSRQNFIPNLKEVEECEKDFSKCQHFSTYPRAHIEKLIKKNVIKKHWFKEDKRKLARQSSLDDANLKSLCEIIPEVIYPKGIITENQEFIYIVQMQVNDDYLYQPVYTGTCKSKNQKCTVIGEGINGIQELKDTTNNGQFDCIQEKSKRQMVGVTINGTVVPYVSASYSSFCVCKYCCAKS